MPRRQKSAREKGYFTTMSARTGKVEHRIRISWYGQMRWFGPYKTKTEALQAIQDKQSEQRAVRDMPGKVRPTRDKLEPIIQAYVDALVGQCEDHRSQKRFAKFWQAQFGDRPASLP